MRKDRKISEYEWAQTNAFFKLALNHPEEYREFFMKFYRNRDKSAVEDEVRKEIDYKKLLEKYVEFQVRYKKTGVDKNIFSMEEINELYRILNDKGCDKPFLKSVT